MLIILAVWAAALLVASVEGETQHCYQCQSRGDYGDCKDPFNTDAAQAGLGNPTQSNIQPCFTGWCMKTLDPDTNAPSTKRFCMSSPPEDNVARCTDAQDGTEGFYKKVYVCYCKGNLCNSGAKSEISLFAVASVLLLALFRQIQ